MRFRARGRWLAAAWFAAGLLVAGPMLPLREGLEAFGRWIEDLGPAALVLYAAAYVLVTVLLLPAAILTFGAGLFFGLLPAVAVVSVGGTLGAAAAFLIARCLARECGESYTRRNARCMAIDRAIGRKGWRIVFLKSLSPLLAGAPAEPAAPAGP